MVFGSYTATTDGYGTHTHVWPQAFSTKCCSAFKSHDSRTWSESTNAAQRFITQHIGICDLTLTGATVGNHFGGCIFAIGY